MSRAMSALCCALLASLAAGCASPPMPAADAYLAKPFSPPERGALVVLLPAPSAQEMPQGTALMTEQLHRQLVASGFKVAALSASNHDEIWRQEATAVGGIYDPATGKLDAQAQGKALAHLAQRVCAELKCAFVLHQRLVLRKAALAGTKAEWDGQRRNMPVKGGPDQMLNLSGDTTGLSVELIAIQADGMTAFRSYGGASLPYRVDVNRERNEVRPDLFADDKELAEGVQIALQPLLVR